MTSPRIVAPRIITRDVIRSAEVSKIRMETSQLKKKEEKIGNEKL